MNAGEHGKLADAAVALPHRHHCVNLVEQRLHVGFCFAFQRVGQNRRRGFRDGAAGPLKADVSDDVALHPGVDRVMIAAQRVVALGGASRAFELVEVARASAVVQDDLLIQLCQVVKHWIQ